MRSHGTWGGTQDAGLAFGNGGDGGRHSHELCRIRIEFAVGWSE